MHLQEQLLTDVRQLMARRGMVTNALINAHLLVLWYNSTYEEWEQLVDSDEGKTWALWGYELHEKVK